MFLITGDFINTEPGDRSKNGLIGPRGCKLEAKDFADHPQAQRFQMLDDDGNIYYTGLFIDTEDNEEGELQPLDCFGMPDAGCTSIEYWNKAKRKYIEV